MNRGLLAAALSMPLTACATASFAPPRVSTQTQVMEQATTSCVAGSAVGSGPTIDENVAGASILIDNFDLAYDCAERELANGRQYFQIPSFLATVVGLVGPSFGLSNDGILAAGTTAGVFNSANSYYAPRDKAGLVSAAHKAVLCIKTEAVDIDYFKDAVDPQKGGGAQVELLQKADQLLANEQADLDARAKRGEPVQNFAFENLSQRRAVTSMMVESLARASATSGSVSISAQKQYFDMVKAALKTTHGILRDRLRDTGTVDMASTFESLKNAVKEHEEAEKALKAKKEENKQLGIMGFTEDVVTLENDELQPRLQQCVLLARG